MTNPENSTSTVSHDSPCSKKSARLQWLWWLALVVAGAFIVVPYLRCIAVRGDLTPMIRFGRDFDSCTVPALRTQPHFVQPGAGFDGQFYAQLGTDPLLLRAETLAALDSFSVRGRRLLIPAVTWALSGGGQIWLVLWVYPLLNLAAWIALAVVAWRILRPAGDAVAVGAFLAIVLGPGAVESASRALPDLPAFVIAFLVIGIPGIGGALLLAVAGLGRETMLLAWPGRVSGLAEWRTNWRRWALDGAITIAPLTLWMLSLYWRFGVGERVDGGNIGVPLSGVMTRLHAVVVHLTAQPITSVSDLILHPAIQCCLLIASVVVQLVFLLRRPQWQDALWRWGVLAGTLSLCLGWTTWEAFFTITRHLLPLHLAFNLLVARSTMRGQWWWLLAGNLYVLPRVLYWVGYP